MQQTAIHITKAFQDAGYEAYFAGGSVRDMLMGSEPQDYDIATSATPDEIEKVVDEMHLESKTIPIGKQFGVILGIVNGHEFEIATFRSDSSASDGRRPDAVFFTSAKEDAVRRDFTINGLFYDPLQKKVIDYVGGQKDIQNKTVRFIGEPHERIKEDHLRILRAIRFRNNFGFDYDPQTKMALQELSHLVATISKERVRDELTKMLLHPNRAHSMRELIDFGIMQHLIPELVQTEEVDQPLQYHQEGDVMNHLLLALKNIPPEWVTEELVWGVLLHDIAKPRTYSEAERIRFDGHAQLSAEMADKILRRLKFPKIKITHITWMIHHHMSIGQIPQMRRAHQVDFFLNPWFEELMRLSYCDERGSLPVDLTLQDQVMALYEEFKSQKLLESDFKPFLDGEEIMKLTGLKPGPKIKELLESLRHAQIEGEVKTRGEAEEWLTKKLSIEI